MKLDEKFKKIWSLNNKKPFLKVFEVGKEDLLLRDEAELKHIFQSRMR